MTDEQKQQVQQLIDNMDTLLKQLAHLIQCPDQWEAKIRNNRTESNKKIQQLLSESKKQLEALQDTEIDQAIFSDMMDKAYAFYENIFGSVSRQIARKQLGSVINEFFQTEEKFIKVCQGHTQDFTRILDCYSQDLINTNKQTADEIEKYRIVLGMFDQLKNHFNSFDSVKPDEVFDTVNILDCIIHDDIFKQQVELISQLLLHYDGIATLFKNIRELKTATVDDQTKIQQWEAFVLSQPMQRLPRYILLLKEFKRYLNAHAQHTHQKYQTRNGESEQQLIAKVDRLIELFDETIKKTGKQQDLDDYQAKIKSYLKANTGTSIIFAQSVNEQKLKTQSVLQILIAHLKNPFIFDREQSDKHSSHYLLIHNIINLNKQDWLQLPESAQTFLKNLVGEAIKNLIKKGSIDEFQAVFANWSNDPTRFPNDQAIANLNNKLMEYYKQPLQSPQQQEQQHDLTNSIFLSSVLNADNSAMFETIIPGRMSESEQVDNDHDAQLSSEIQEQYKELMHLFGDQENGFSEKPSNANQKKEIAVTDEQFIVETSQEYHDILKSMVFVIDNTHQAPAVAILSDDDRSERPASTASPRSDSSSTTLPASSPVATNSDRSNGFSSSGESQGSDQEDRNANVEKNGKTMDANQKNELSDEEGMPPSSSPLLPSSPFSTSTFFRPSHQRESSAGSVVVQQSTQTSSSSMENTVVNFSMKSGVGIPPTPPSTSPTSKSNQTSTPVSSAHGGASHHFQSSDSLHKDIVEINTAPSPTSVLRSPSTNVSGEQDTGLRTKSPDVQAQYVSFSENEDVSSEEGEIASPKKSFFARHKTPIKVVTGVLVTLATVDVVFGGASWLAGAFHATLLSVPYVAVAAGLVGLALVAGIGLLSLVAKEDCGDFWGNADHLSVSSFLNLESEKNFPQNLKSKVHNTEYANTNTNTDTEERLTKSHQIP
jgi:hypothetical protein